MSERRGSYRRNENMITRTERILKRYLKIWLGLFPDFVHNVPELPKGGELEKFINAIESEETKHCYCMCHGCGKRLKYCGQGSCNFCPECGREVSTEPRHVNDYFIG